MNGLSGGERVKPAGPVFDKTWRAECVVEIAERAETDWMIRRHYLGKWPGVTVLTLAMKRAARRAIGRPSPFCPETSKWCERWRRNWPE